MTEKEQNIKRGKASLQKNEWKITIFDKDDTPPQLNPQRELTPDSGSGSGKSKTKNYQRILPRENIPPKHPEGHKNIPSQRFMNLLTLNSSPRSFLNHCEGMARSSERRVSSTNRKSIKFEKPTNQDEKKGEKSYKEDPAQESCPNCQKLQQKIDRLKRELKHSKRLIEDLQNSNQALHLMVKNLTKQKEYDNNLFNAKIFKTQASESTHRTSKKSNSRKEQKGRCRSRRSTSSPLTQSLLFKSRDRITAKEDSECSRKQHILIQHRHSNTMQDHSTELSQFQKQKNKIQKNLVRNSYFNFSKLMNRKLPTDSDSIQILNNLKTKFKVVSDKELVRKIESILTQHSRNDKFVKAVSRLAMELNFAKYEGINLSESPKLLWKWIKAFFSDYMEVKQKEEQYIKTIKKLKKMLEEVESHLKLQQKKAQNTKQSSNEGTDFKNKVQRLLLGNEKNQHPLPSTKLLEELIEVKFAQDGLNKLKKRVIGFFEFDERLSTNDVIDKLEKISLLKSYNS